MLLGDPGVGKSSLIVKLINNFQDLKSMDDSVIGISQEITKHTLFEGDEDELRATFVSDLLCL